MYRYRNMTDGTIVPPSTILKDGAAQPFVFVGPCPDDPYWILGMTPESVGAFLCAVDTEEITVRRNAADFGLTPARESAIAEAFAWFTDDEANIALSDGRSVAVHTSGQITVWSPDRMHGARFVVPPGVEWSSSITVPCEYMSANQGNVGQDQIGLFLKCASYLCPAKFHGVHITDSVLEVRATARGHGWTTLNGADFCPDHKEQKVIKGA